MGSLYLQSTIDRPTLVRRSLDGKINAIVPFQVSTQLLKLVLDNLPRDVCYHVLHRDRGVSGRVGERPIFNFGWEGGVEVGQLFWQTKRHIVYRVQSHVQLLSCKQLKHTSLLCLSSQWRKCFAISVKEVKHHPKVIPWG